MFSSGTMVTLFFVCYVLVLFSTLTGLLKLAFKENEVLEILHRMAGPINNLLYMIFFVVSSFGMVRMIPRMIITALFILLVYAGFVTGNRKDKPWLLIVHRILGVLIFALFTMLLVLFLIM